MSGTLPGTGRGHTRVMWWPLMRRWLVRVWLFVGLGLFGYVLTRQPLASIGDAVAAMGPLVLAAPLIALSWFATRTTTLELVLGGEVPWRRVFVTRFVGDGYNAILPMAGIGGEPFKLKMLADWLALEHAFTGLLRDRIIDNAVGLAFSAGCIGFALPAFAVPAAARDALWTYTLVAPAVGVVLLALMITRLPGRFGALVARWLADTTREPAPLPLATLGRAVGWSLATRLLQACETALLLYCIGMAPTPCTIALVDGALNAAGFVGFMFPQGLGMVEGTAVYLLGALGAAPADAAAFALARRGRMLLVSIFGIAVHVGGRWRGRTRSGTGHGAAMMGIQPDR